MEQIFFSTVIFSTCFFFLSIGVLISGKPIQGSCGRRKGDLLSGDGLDIECLCETSGDDSACSGISEGELIDAMLRAKEDFKDVERVSKELNKNLP